MSKGPGHIARLVLSLIEAEPNGAWMVSDICRLAYPEANRIEKKHRVAVARTLRTMKLPGTWCRMTVKNEWCLCDECNLVSMARRDVLIDYYPRQSGHIDVVAHMARYPHRYKPDKDWKSNTWAIVDRAKRYRDASPAVKLDMDIEAKEQRYNMYRRMGYGHESLAEISQQIADLKAKKKELAPTP